MMKITNQKLTIIILFVCDIALLTDSEVILCRLVNEFAGV